LEGGIIRRLRRLLFGNFGQEGLGNLRNWGRGLEGSKLQNPLFFPIKVPFPLKREARGGMEEGQLFQKEAD